MMLAVRHGVLIQDRVQVRGLAISISYLLAAPGARVSETREGTNAS
jgi:hypothetical protein